MDSPVCGKTKAQLKREGHTEKTTQAYCLDRLTAMEMQGKCWHFRNNSFAGKILRPNGTTGFLKNNKKGAPDIICCFNSQFVGIEVKGPSGTYEESQEPAHLAIRRAGGTVWTVYCPEDLEHYLTYLS